MATFKRKQVGLVQTSLPGQKESLLDKTRDSINRRLKALEAGSVKEIRCNHEAGAVAQAVERQVRQGMELVLSSGIVIWKSDRTSKNRCGIITGRLPLPHG